MADARPPEPTTRQRAEGKPAEPKLSPAALRKLARAHSEAAVQVLAEVATTGSSEASRISAAMALLDRGYGKSGTAAKADDKGRAPILYQRIEIIDGTQDSSEQDRQAPDCQD
jgi:hypothetical protein